MPIHKMIEIPIYDVLLYLVSSPDPIAERIHMNDIFGELKTFDWNALCSSKEFNFGLFFTSQPRIATIAHEVFHLTHRILDRAGVPFSIENQEAGALLHGYLFDLVMKEIPCCYQNVK